MNITCLDLEGVLLPEFWQEFAMATSIPELMRTTRDEPDYDKLMKMRLRVLDENGYGIDEIRKIANKMDPLDGAPEFLDWLRERSEVAILTGSYYQYIKPLMKKLGDPFMCANDLKIEKDGRIVGYKLREKDGKIEMIERFRAGGFGTIAVGDSNNDVSMLRGADYGILFRAKPDLIARENLDSAETYDQLKEHIDSFIN